MPTLNHPQLQIESGIFSLADRSFHRLMASRKGWARFRLALFDLSPRWQWWALVLLTKRLPPLPYPKIGFATQFPDHAGPMRMIRECLRPPDARFEDFLDWILFGCGGFDTKQLPRGLTPSLARHWEATFDLALLLREPGDWLGHYYETVVASPSMKSSTGFFSTPMSLCHLMVELHRPGLMDSVHEPCCGSGRMLMAASNYSINLSGTDINPTLVKICQANAWLYMPSVVLPLRGIISEATPIQIERKILNTLKRSLPNGYPKS